MTPERFQEMKDDASRGTLARADIAELLNEFGKLRLQAKELTISDMVQRSFEGAKAKGFHDVESMKDQIRAYSLPARLCLIHSEVSEALESYRKDPSHLQPFWIDEEKGGKPEGILSELADVVIRVGDLCGVEGWDLASAITEKLAFNLTREHLHGGKRL